MENLFRILKDGGHAAVIQANTETVNQIALQAGQTFGDCLRLAINENEDVSLRSWARILLSRAKWSNRYSGLVILETDNVTDERLLAALELMGKLTTQNILVCTQKLRETAAAVMKAGFIPGIWTFRAIENDCCTEIMAAANRAKIAFINRSAMKAAVNLAEEIRKSALFSADAFVNAAADCDRIITGESLKAQELDGGYISLCREFGSENRKEKSVHRGRKIGFISDPEEHQYRQEGRI